MSAVSSARALRTMILGHPRRYLAVGVIVLLSLVFARAAYASTIYAYYHAFANPGVPHDSAGWNWREHNRVCRDDAATQSFGLLRAADYDGNGYLAYDTGHVVSQCQLGYIARIETNGYFLTRCWNSDTGGCQTTKP